jgi:sugar phosphate isomerase/epimerase
MNFNIPVALVAGLSCAVFTILLPTAIGAPVGTGPGFKGPVGLQLYSFRQQFARDVPGTLDKVRDLGFKDVELAGTYNVSPEEFKKLLDARGLTAVSGHFPYERFRNDLQGIIRESKALGLQYAGCAWIPHKDPFDENTCREAIATFNLAGDALAKQGIKFFFHTHGYEFQPQENGTLFDTIMTGTRPDLVAVEMDIFWVVHAGQDPVALFNRYGNRIQLLHLKGMKDNTLTGLLTGKSDVTNDVPLGVGKIDLPPILQAAKKAGAKWYFIEDESPTADKQIPQSLLYLEQLQ